ncbi:hypothetical protein IMW75_24610 [Pseudomonas gregormendelii]|uniref:Uncharacterized protein n=1 Tax=Pseudomonas gregormendelii TaxID=1628277 RepID=A0ABS3ANR3_9PSED|nr:hypothetical protein [Pseudomonas gregormendelii]MBN3968441.1 hypothetical protein [Pseudomonas gregormendelii]
MNEEQHQRRIVLWQGSFSVITAFALLILVLLLSDRTPPVISKHLLAQIRSFKRINLRRWRAWQASQFRQNHHKAKLDRSSDEINPSHHRFGAL